MNRFLLTAIISCISFASLCQVNSGKEVYLKLSGGHVSFGSGDFLGYSILMEVSKNLIKNPSPGINKLLLGGELIFENGVNNPVVHNPTLSQFFTTFYHVSSSNLWAKLSYHPFGKIAGAFNVQVGPTIGYSKRSMESGAMRTVDIMGRATRYSVLSYDNGVTYGYRISTGLEFALSRSLLAGLRIDFANNNEGEINTMLGARFGLRL